MNRRALWMVGLAACLLLATASVACGDDDDGIRHTVLLGELDAAYEQIYCGNELKTIVRGRRCTLSQYRSRYCGNFLHEDQKTFAVDLDFRHETSDGLG